MLIEVKVDHLRIYTMVITRRRIRVAIKKYVDAAIEDSCKNAGDVKSRYGIEDRLWESKKNLDILIQLIVPKHGVEVERKDAH